MSAFEVIGIVLGGIVGATLFLTAVAGLFQAAWTGRLRPFVQGTACLLLMYLVASTVFLAVSWAAISSAFSGGSPRTPSLWSDYEHRLQEEVRKVDEELVVALGAFNAGLDTQKVLDGYRAARASGLEPGPAMKRALEGLDLR